MAVVYPNEVWPADAAVESLDGTTDPATGLPYIAKGTGPASTPSYEVQYNRRQERLNRILAVWRSGMVVDEGDLKIGAYPMDFVMNGVFKSFQGISGVAIPDDSSRAVYLDASATLQTGAFWPADVSTFVPLASVTTSGGSMAIIDERGAATFRVPSVESALVRDRRIVTACCASVGVGQSDVEVFAFEAAEDLTLEAVQVYCTATAATASVDVKSAASSVLSSVATPVARSVVKPGILDSSITAGETVTVHVTTNASGSIGNLSVMLLLKAVLSA